MRNIARSLIAYAAIATSTFAQFGVGIRNDTPSGGGSPEGTAVLSTGETGTPLLQADGDDTSSWTVNPSVTSLTASGAVRSGSFTDAAGTGPASATQGITVADNKFITSADPTSGAVVFRVGNDTNTGMGPGAADELNLVSGGVTGLSLSSSLATFTTHIVASGNIQNNAWFSSGSGQQAVTLGAGAATFEITETYVVIAAHSGGNTITTITQSGGGEGVFVWLMKSGANALTISASGTGAYQVARACVMDAADSTAVLHLSEGGYWRLMSCVP
jgi:hypothetical protein